MQTQSFRSDSSKTAGRHCAGCAKEAAGRSPRSHFLRAFYIGAIAGALCIAGCDGPAPQPRERPAQSTAQKADDYPEQLRGRSPSELAGIVRSGIHPMAMKTEALDMLARQATRPYSFFGYASPDSMPLGKSALTELLALGPGHVSNEKMVQILEEAAANGRLAGFLTEVCRKESGPSGIFAGDGRNREALRRMAEDPETEIGRRRLATYRLKCMEAARPEDSGGELRRSQASDSFAGAAGQGAPVESAEATEKARTDRIVRMRGLVRAVNDAGMPRSARRDAILELDAEHGRHREARECIAKNRKLLREAEETVRRRGEKECYDEQSITCIHNPDECKPHPCSTTDVRFFPKGSGRHSKRLHENP